MEDRTRRAVPAPAPTRRRVALRACFVLLLAGLSACDLDWEEKASAAYFQAVAAEEKEADYSGARRLYEQALECNPYHPPANRRLAELYFSRLFSEKGATETARLHFRRYLDLQAGTPRDVAVVKDYLRVLDRLADGTMEDPRDAVLDLLTAAEKNSRTMFFERLHADFIVELGRQKITPDQYLDRWRKRSKGATPTFYFRDVVRFRDDFTAVVVLGFGESGKAERRELRWQIQENGLWALTGDRAAPTMP